MSVKIQQPIKDGSLRTTNFFNGRLVTGADMTREQTARREAASRVGQAAGEGIVYGLEVEKDSSAGREPIVKINAGLAINRCGQSLFLPQDTSLHLQQRDAVVSQASSIFGECGEITIGNFNSGFGLYLLVMSPAQMSEGSAPTNGLNNVFSNCNTDVILETVQFRRLAIEPFLAGEKTPDQNRLRNYIAYRCFGTRQGQKIFADPVGLSLDSYGLIDEMRGKTLARSEVPLAIIYWTKEGIQFVENWAVRRRLANRTESGNWTQLLSDRRLSESEASMRQFEDQIKKMLIDETKPSTVRAEEYFEFLPPAGILPIETSKRKGFNIAAFFGSRVSPEKNIRNTDGDRLRLLFSNALRHEPIDLNSGEKIRLYFVRENIRALEKGENIQKVVVFARHSLSTIGVARFDEAIFNTEDAFEDAVK